MRNKDTIVELSPYMEDCPKCWVNYFRAELNEELISLIKKHIDFPREERLIFFNEKLKKYNGTISIIGDSVEPEFSHIEFNTPADKTFWLLKYS